MWDFMCSYADAFYSNSERVLSVIWAWVFTLVPVLFFAFCFIMLGFCVWCGVSEFLTELRSERGASNE